MISIRQALFCDIPSLVAMGANLHAESPRYSVTTYSPHKVERLAQAIVMGRVPDSVIFVAEEEENGELIGMFAGAVTEHWFSEDKIATDYTFYVRPEYRGRGKTAVRVVRAFERWALARGVKSLVFGSSTEINTERTADLYKALGYHEYSIALIKHVTGAHVGESGH